MEDHGAIADLTSTARIDAAQFGARAARLGALAHAGAPVPEGRVVDFDLSARIGSDPDALDQILDAVAALTIAGDLVLVRASPGEPSWGGPASMRNVGFCLSRLEPVARRLGSQVAEAGFLACVRDYAVSVAGMDSSQFEELLGMPGRQKRSGSGIGEVLTGTAPDRIMHALDVFKTETGDDFPDDPGEQLRQVLGAMARDWNRPSARILRQANGAPADAGLGFIIQRQVPGDGRGRIQAVDPVSGMRTMFGGYGTMQGAKPALGKLSPDSLDALPQSSRTVLEMAVRAGENYLSDAAQVTFSTDGDAVHIIDLFAASRSDSANLQIIVDLANEQVLSREEAILKADPRTITAHLHPQIAPDQTPDALSRGIAASPGAGQGPIHFSAEGVQAAAARGTPGILVRAETMPEDIRGMASASAVLTLTGGLTSHAAVIAQGLGVPCVVGASQLRIDDDRRCLIAPDGRVIEEGETLTIDGTSGWILNGALKLEQTDVPPAFDTIMDWADELREMGVRANADTKSEAQSAVRFGVDGIGLCRTEHMFYENDRITVMREMILAEDHETRRDALDRLLPMQRADFTSLFDIMAGLPVTIRLLDPPLHEFLPSDKRDIAELATAMNMSQDALRRRIEEMGEFNPMLGKRGVRLAVTMPEIYEMQARAIFEAAIAISQKTEIEIVPEIMIPLVSAHREVELVKDRLDSVARLVEQESNITPNYRLGVMVETPRAALRAGDLAKSTSFLSFGTNDLTQMTYGLSRDDSGRFMREYVNEGVFAEDPFLTLDLEGVGELLLTAARRGRRAQPHISLGLCGEHGGDPASIRFCQIAGFDYVSCSPYRVPIARLAAAQATLLIKSADQNQHP